MICKFKGYNSFLEKVQAVFGLSTTAIEVEKYSINHALIGHKLAQSWELDYDMCEAILQHHEYKTLSEETESKRSIIHQLVALALMAEQLCAEHRDGTECREWSAGGNWAVKTLGISESQVDQLSMGSKSMIGI